jgi:hypothetical protein
MKQRLAERKRSRAPRSSSLSNDQSLSFNFGKVSVRDSSLGPGLSTADESSNNGLKLQKIGS